MMRTVSYKIDFYDDDGAILHSKITATEMDYWELCGSTLGNLPDGAVDFQLTELTGEDGSPATDVFRTSTALSVRENTQTRSACSSLR